MMETSLQSAMGDRAVEEGPAPAHGLPGAALRRVLEHIDANLDRSPRLSELSALAHMSRFHFARLFKRSTGVSPHRFVVGRRIDHAKALLAARGTPIATIGRTVGFRTPSHFTNVFRRSTGMTPTVYRFAARDPATASGAEPGPELDVASAPELAISARAS